MYHRWPWARKRNTNNIPEMLWTGSPFHTPGRLQAPFWMIIPQQLMRLAASVCQQTYVNKAWNFNRSSQIDAHRCDSSIWRPTYEETERLASLHTSYNAVLQHKDSFRRKARYDTELPTPAMHSKDFAYVYAYMYIARCNVNDTPSYFKRYFRS